MKAEKILMPFKGVLLFVFLLTLAACSGAHTAYLSGEENGSSEISDDSGQALLSWRETEYPEHAELLLPQLYEADKSPAPDEYGEVWEIAQMLSAKEEPSDIVEYEEQFTDLHAVIVNDAGAVWEIPEEEIADNRQNGWYIKRYSKGLDELSEQIEEYISRLSGSWGIYVKNLSNGRCLVINDGRYDTASIIKLFVMASAYNEISYGGIEKDERVSGLLEDMITVSDNYASNRLVKIIGGGNYKAGFDAENANTKSAGCLNTQHYSLFIGFGDFVAYGKNYVSPLDCGIMLEKIYRGELVSEEYSLEMLELLKRQQKREKIPALLPEGTVIANKTGETDTVQSDIGIVYSPACDYIICVISNKSKNGIQSIRELSKTVYDYFNQSDSDN